MIIKIKQILKKIGIGLLIVIGIIAIILITNKTFFKTYYTTTNDKKETVKIPVPAFSFYESKSGKYNVTFLTIRSVANVRNILGDYVENLTSCYDESYFYDKDLGITISKYTVEKGNIFNKIYLTYTKGNYCETEFVLDNDWMTEFKEKAVIEEVNVASCTGKSDDTNCTVKNVTDYNVEEYYNYMNKDTITRIENKTNINYEGANGTYVIYYYYTLNKKSYTLSIFAYNTTYLAFEVIDSNDHSQNAVYNMNTDANQLLKDFYNQQ